MSEEHLALELHSWTAEATRRWFARCDLCRVRRLVADYFEGYLHHGPHDMWLWACSSCLMNEISDRLDEKDEPAHAPWGEWGQSTATGFNNMHGRRGMPDTGHVEGTWPAHKCELCRAMAEASEREETTT